MKCLLMHKGSMGVRPHVRSPPFLDPPLVTVS